MTSKQKSTTVTLRAPIHSTIEGIKRLKMRNDISIINFVQTGHVEDGNDVVNSLVDILRTNHNVKSLNCSVCYASMVPLFQALAAGKAGYSLESLQELYVYLYDTDATVLGSYLTTNRNLKRLGVAFRDYPAAVKLVSCLACSSVVELELEVFDNGGKLRELGTKLGKCNSIVSLKMIHSLYDQPDDIKSFFTEGLANMRCLTHLDIHRKGYISSSTCSIYEDGFLEMVKSSKCITTAVLNGTSLSFRDEITSFCILNRVFGTNLIGFEPTELWTRVLAKIRNDSARATFLFRLIREKPELLVGNLQPACKGSKCQRLYSLLAMCNLSASEV